MERVTLALPQHAQTEHAFGEWRVGKSDLVTRIQRKPNPNHDGRLVGALR
jgi:hypothetical protein